MEIILHHHVHVWISSWSGCCSPCPNPKSKHNMTWKGYISVASHNKPNISCNFDSDLKQFIIKYEHFVQGQLHFTKKQNHTTKIAGVWFTTWIMVWNHVYISLKFTKKKKFSSGLAVVLLKFSGVITLTHVISPSLKLRMDVKKSTKLSFTLLWRWR